MRLNYVRLIEKKNLKAHLKTQRKLYENFNFIPLNETTSESQMAQSQIAQTRKRLRNIIAIDRLKAFDFFLSISGSSKKQNYVGRGHSKLECRNSILKQHQNRNYKITISLAVAKQT